MKVWSCFHLLIALVLATYYRLVQTGVLDGAKSLEVAILGLVLLLVALWGLMSGAVWK